MNDRVEIALFFAFLIRGEKEAKPFDYFLADQFLSSGIMLEHDRLVKKRTIEQMAAWIPDNVSSLQDGTSATHWLADRAAEL